MKMNKRSRGGQRRGSLTMAVVAVVSVLLVLGVAYGRDNEHPRDPVTRELQHLDFLYPGRRARQDHTRSERRYEDRPESKVKHTVVPVFIPVRYDLRKRSSLERRVTEDESISPRLVMDEDFNIKFDNPNIMPLTKPLAFILNSEVNARENRHEENEHVMIPFPVLVKAREDTGGCRHDDVLEHRTNYDEGDDSGDDYIHEHPPLNYRKVIPSYRYMKNGTTTFHKTNNPPASDVYYPIRSKNYPESSKNYPESSKTYPESTLYKSGIPPGRTHSYNSSSQEHLDAYPGKIFADMYRTLPKHALESVESQEGDDYYYYDKRRHAGDTKLRLKPFSKRPYRGHAFSASTDLHWVTDSNFTKVKKEDEDLKNFVIFDVTEPLEPKATTTTTTTSLPNIDEDWGKKILSV